MFCSIAEERTIKFFSVIWLQLEYISVVAPAYMLWVLFLICNEEALNGSVSFFAMNKFVFLLKNKNLWLQNVVQCIIMLVGEVIVFDALFIVNIDNLFMTCMHPGTQNMWRRNVRVRLTSPPSRSGPTTAADFTSVSQYGAEAGVFTQIVRGKYWLPQEDNRGGKIFICKEKP